MACRRSFQSFHRLHYYSSAFSQVSSSPLCRGFSHSRGYMFHVYSSLAQQLLDEISQPNFPDFHNVIRRHSNERSFPQVLQVYASMLSHGFLPNGSTLNFIIKACTALPALSFGWAVHAQAVLLGFEAVTFVQNGIIVMYARFSEIATARAVFDKLANKDVVSWTSIMSGYVQNGYPFDALQIFRTMRMDSTVIPDFIALVSALKACMDVGDLEQGSSVHVLVVKFGVEDEPDLLTTLISMYAKCGQVHVARDMFDLVTSPEPLLWNAMISGYAKNGIADEAVDLFKEMVARNVQPDSITLRSAILACAQIGCLEAAKWIWGFVNANGFESDIFVSTAVINMFAKCGSMVLARSVFESIPKKDVVVWSAVIMGYGLHGQVKEAIELFHGMILSNIQPNDVTFVGLLSACKHSGLVEDGRRYFYSMKEHAIEPRHQHYACLVDLLARSGHLEEAFMFIRGMPMAPKVTVWGALLNACRIYGNVELGKYAAEQVFAIEPTNAGHYVQLSNIYASLGMWKDVARIRVLMKERGAKKTMGFSSIEINGKLQSFYAGDKSHPRSMEIYAMLDKLEAKLKKSGFLPHLDLVLHDVGHEEKELSLRNHSERIAIAYGLICTPPGTVLRIIKNLRACVNCHSATKLISKIEQREIIVRDANRFHHFKYGLCSCSDYW